MSRRSRSLNLLEPQEPHQACSGKPLLSDTQTKYCRSPVCLFIRNRSSTDKTVWIRQILARRASRTGQCIRYLWISSNHAIQSVTCRQRDECGTTMELVRLIQMCLNETHSTVGAGKYLLNILVHVFCGTRMLNAMAFELSFGIHHQEVQRTRNPQGKNRNMKTLGLA